MLSTMQTLIAANERLRRAGQIDRVVYWLCLAAVAVVIGMECAL